MGRPPPIRTLLKEGPDRDDLLFVNWVRWLVPESPGGGGGAGFGGNGEVVARGPHCDERLGQEAAVPLSQGEFILLCRKIYD